jgi:hypothetical protein
MTVFRSGQDTAAGYDRISLSVFVANFADVEPA